MPVTQEQTTTPVAPGLDSLTLTVTEEMHVRASIETTFAALLEELGPENRGMHDAPMPMVLEAWPAIRCLFPGKQAKLRRSLVAPAFAPTRRAHRTSDKQDYALFISRELFA